MKVSLPHVAGFAMACIALLVGCGNLGGPERLTMATPVAIAVTVAVAAKPEMPQAMPAAAGVATSAPAPAPAAPMQHVAIPASEQIAPAPVDFEAAVSRAGEQLFRDARAMLGDEPRSVVVDPLIDANTGAQTVSTVRMGARLESVLEAQQPGWLVQPLTRAALASQPLLLIGTLTPVNTERSIDTPPDAYRVWLTLIDLRTGNVVAKKLDRATLDSVNPAPLAFYQDSPTWHKDKTVGAYIDSCQVNTLAGDPADPDYLARLPAAAVVNEAIIAYGDGKVPLANQLYREAQTLAEPGDLRVLNGLYLTSWQTGQREAARQAFDRLVASGLESKRLPIKLLFQPGRTAFNQVGDLPAQYRTWIDSLASETRKVSACVRVVGHTSRTGSARLNDTLSRQRAEAVMKMLERSDRTLMSRLDAAGVGSREALIGLGTDDQRDALDRRVEFRVVDCV